MVELPEIISQMRLSASPPADVQKCMVRPRSPIWLVITYPEEHWTYQSRERSVGQQSPRL